MGSGVSGSYKNTTGSNSSPVKSYPNSADENKIPVVTTSSPIRVRKKKGISDGVASGGGGASIGGGYTGHNKPAKKFRVGDTVVIIESFKGFVIGTIGIIKSQLADDYYEVELFDMSNNSCGVFVVPAEALALFE